MSPIRRASVLGAACLVAVSPILSGCAEEAAINEEPRTDVAFVEPGTPLRDGFSVVEGTRPLGPVLDIPISILEFNSIGYTGDGSGDGASAVEGPAWRAFLVVEHEPERVWDDYVAQLRAGVSAGGAGGAWGAACIPYAPSAASPQLSCLAFSRTMIATGGTRNAVLTMRSTEGDVNPGYLLVTDVADQDFLGAYPDNPAGLPPWPSGQPFPSPPTPSAAPEPGEPLAPRTTDVEEYIVLEDTRLLAVYGGDGGTGGFDVFLSVDEDADLAAVATAYLHQTPRSGGPGCQPAFDTPDARVSMCGPVGGSGGYTATVLMIDRLQGADYLLYEAHND